MTERVGQDGAPKYGADQDNAPALGRGVLGRGAGRDGAFEDEMRLERVRLCFDKRIPI